MSNPKHILVIRFSAMGDVAMTIPVIRAFAEQYPDVKITFLTKGFHKPFFSNIKNVSVYSADLKGKHKGILGLYRLSKELKTLNIDAIADLHNVLRTKILKMFLGKIDYVQIDKGRSEKKKLTTGKIFKPLKTTHQRYADVFKNLGYHIDVSNPSFPDPLSLPKIPDLKSTLDKRYKKWVGVAPFAAHGSKMYPLADMSSVIKILSNDYKVFLFGGGRKEITLLDAIANNNDDIINLAGKLPFNDELSVISNLDLMISMDSGNGHLAAMFGVKVISIWGVTHPYAGFVPFNQPTDYALLADRERYPLIPTSVYGNKFPKGYENAAGSIKPEAIVKKVDSVLKD